MIETHKFIPGDKVYVKPDLHVRAGWPAGMGHIVKKRGYACDEYSFRPDGTTSEHAWYPASDICIISRKGVNFAMIPPAAHVKIKVSGSARKIELLHWVLSRLDPDWPWTPENSYDPAKTCGACAGAIYKNPNFTADDIRTLAKQIDGLQRISGGLKIELKKFNVQARCSKIDKESSDPATEVVVVGGEAE